MSGEELGAAGGEVRLGPSPVAPSPSRCVICGASLEALRADARYCSDAHKTEAYRLRRLLNGKPAGPYNTVEERLAAIGRPRGGSRHTRPLMRGIMGLHTKRPRDAPTPGAMAQEE